MFFFCVISTIAQSPVVPTFVEAVKLALSAFVLLYAFVANSALLTVGTATGVTLTVFFAVCSMVAMGMAVQGSCFRNLDPVTRLIFLAVGLGLIVPWLLWNLISLVLSAAGTA